MLLSAYGNEKNAGRSKRIRLIIGVRVGGQTIVSTTEALHMSRMWGQKWHSRYKKEGLKGLDTRPRPGRPPSVRPDIMKKVRKLSLKTTSWRASEMREFIHEMTGREFDISYVRRMMGKWGFTQKSSRIGAYQQGR